MYNVMIQFLVGILTLLVLFQVKHFLADYPFQTEYMLGKFKAHGWFKPLVAHALVHGLGTFIIASYFGAAHPIVLALFDAVIHFTMDRVKASPALLGRWKALSGAEYMDVKTDIETTSYIYEGKAIDLRYSPTYRRAQDRLRGNKLFWWALGFDQMVHHLTHYAVIFLMVVGF